MSWSALRSELAAWRAAGCTPHLWWRDDDAALPTAPLRKLLSLSQKSGVPIALAVIPLLAQADAIAEASAVLMHGCDHRNRAASGEKKTEFSAAESDDAALARLAGAREKLERLAGKRLLPVLAPPWNRIREDLVPRLPQVGFNGLSRYGARRTHSDNVREVNTHVDLIGWRQDRRFVGEEAAIDALVRELAERRQSGTADEPVGILTHHALHDAAAWRFLERLFDETRAAGARWAAAAEIF
jgi:peptidoglycan/xylan/chitin deacetylase (PgdA/CDA1 family)